MSEIVVFIYSDLSYIFLRFMDIFVTKKTIRKYSPGKDVHTHIYIYIKARTHIMSLNLNSLASSWRIVRQQKRARRQGPPALLRELKKKGFVGQEI